MASKKLLASRLAAGAQHAALIGFDGFVDEVVHVVDRRVSPDEYTRVDTLCEYGRRIARASGLSFNVEIMPVAEKLGGNGPIFALGLKKLGVPVSYIGCTGIEAAHPVFAELTDGSRVIGVEEPGRTDAMEFHDGKIIRSKLASLNRLGWASVTARISPSELAALMDGCDLISFNNWTMLPHMSDIWRHIIAECLPLMQAPLGNKTMFFDLADPEKRGADELKEAIELIRRFHGSGMNTVLGLNKKEVCEVYETLCGTKIADYAAFDLRELTCAVARRIGIDCVVVHPVDRAACADADGYHEQTGPLCRRPVLTTGAGDNFNAGFIYAYVNGCCADDCLTAGCAASGYYVRNARSASTGELCGFLADWENGLLND